MNCEDSPTWRGWLDGYNRYVDGHSGYIDSLGKEEANRIRKSRQEKLSGKVGWSRGLTKDSDERLAKAAGKRSKTVKQQFSEGSRQSWNKGLTKETDDRVRKNAAAVADAYASGRAAPWAKGLSIETSDKVAQMAKNVSLRHNNPKLRSRLDDLKRRSKTEIEDLLKNQAPNFKLLTSLEQYVNDKFNNLTFECLVCKDRKVRSLSSILTNRCYTCNPSESSQQLEINNFVCNLNFDTVLSTRSVISPYELDIWIPQKNFAIEYNGLYFHRSPIITQKDYHQMKTEYCREANITLFHIFGDEWRDKRKIVESMIKHRLGASSRTIFARKCQIVSLTTAERRAFFRETHLDGDVGASACLGLKHKGDTVAALSLRSPRQKRYAGFNEIARFACALDTSVPGGLSRLLKSVRGQSSKPIMTYVDQRHGTGQGYAQADLKHVGETALRWWWTDDVDRFNRFKFRANAKKGLTESAVAEMAGVHRIYGCRNWIYQLL